MVYRIEPESGAVWVGYEIALLSQYAVALQNWSWSAVWQVLFSKMARARQGTGVGCNATWGSRFGPFNGTGHEVVIGAPVRLGHLASLFASS